MPFNPERLISEDGSIEMCSMAESIAHNLMLLITTKKGENRFDFGYGNAVWDIEFENAVTAVEWEALFIESMKEQIRKYEPRIYAPKIDVSIEYVEHSYETKRYSEIKKKAKIAINAKLAETGETFSFLTELFLSPMSVD
ncbi:MAG TPA: GPW/gp25 family protein [Flavobacterium sp.]|nr:GPW/gp25 family protein [Flavobacterium sp.]